MNHGALIDHHWDVLLQHPSHQNHPPLRRSGSGRAAHAEQNEKEDSTLRQTDRRTPVESKCQNRARLSRLQHPTTLHCRARSSRSLQSSSRPSPFSFVQSCAPADWTDDLVSVWTPTACPDIDVQPCKCSNYTPAYALSHRQRTRDGPRPETC